MPTRRRSYGARHRGVGRVLRYGAKVGPETAFVRARHLSVRIENQRMRFALAAGISCAFAVRTPGSVGEERTIPAK